MQLTRDDFEYWLFEMDEQLQSFFALLPKSLAANLDYSEESLSELERWLLSKYPSIHDIILPSEKHVLDNASRYVGEVFRRTLGGKWNIDLVNSKNAYYNLPVVQNGSQWTECPVTLVTASLDRRTGHYIGDVLRAYIKRHGLKE